MVANLVLLLLPLLAGAVAPQPEQLAGGLEDQPVSSPEMQDALRSAIQAYNQAADSKFYIRDVKLIRAQTQVVAGINYILTVEVAPTECLKSSPSNDFEKCQIPAGASHSVWSSRFWIKETHAGSCAKSNCIVPSYCALVLAHDLRKERESSSTLKTIKNFQQGNSKAMSYNKWQVLNISSTSTIENTQTHPATEAALKVGVCEFILWSRPWENKQELTDYSCKPMTA